MASILPVFVPHAGCPCRCVFCNQRTIAGQTERMTPERARAELEAGLRICQTPPQAAFYGGSFTAIPEAEQEALLAVTDALIAAGRLSGVRCSTRPDAIDPPTLERLRRHAVHTIELGAQSMDNAVLCASARGHTAEDTERAAKLVKDAGFELILQMMAGLPGDTRETVRETAERIAALKPDGVRIYPVAVLPDTPLAELWRRGEYTPLTLQTAAEWCADALEVFEREGIAVLRVGLNPTEELGSAVLAGAYHPAMGELAYGELYFWRMRRAMLEGADGQFAFPRREMSRAVGQKKKNLTRLREEFGARVVIREQKEKHV